MKSEEAASAAQCAAFRLAAGLDLDVVLRAPATEREAVALRLRRLLERERLKGARRHWSYDLNRHIALKQALDRIASGERGGDKERQVGAQAKPKRRPEGAASCHRQTGQR